MLQMRFRSALLLVLGLSWTVGAQGQSPMREGSWEVSMKINIPGMEGAPAFKQTQCVTAAMLKDPSSAMPSGPGGDCKISDYKLADNVATYKLACTQPAPVNAVGELRYTGPDAYTGTLTMDMSGQNLVLSIDAKRIGDCSK
jgi:Protein of unknown function (DUF3617)